MRWVHTSAVAASLLGIVLLGGCGILTDGIMGTGATPYTKEVRILVLANVADTLNQIPVPGATVSIEQTTSNQPTKSGATTTTMSQSMATDPSGVVLFRVEPGESYKLTVSASGYSSATLLISPSYYTPRVVNRIVNLAPTTSSTTGTTGTTTDTTTTPATT